MKPAPYSRASNLELSKGDLKPSAPSTSWWTVPPDQFYAQAKTEASRMAGVKEFLNYGKP